MLYCSAVCCVHSFSSADGGRVQQDKNKGENFKKWGFFNEIKLSETKVECERTTERQMKWLRCSRKYGVVMMMMKMGMMVTGTMVAFMLQLYDCFGPQSYVSTCCLVMHSC